MWRPNLNCSRSPVLSALLCCGDGRARCGRHVRSPGFTGPSKVAHFACHAVRVCSHPMRGRVNRVHSRVGPASGGCCSPVCASAALSTLAHRVRVTAGVWSRRELPRAASPAGWPAISVLGRVLTRRSSECTYVMNAAVYRVRNHATDPRNRLDRITGRLRSDPRHHDMSPFTTPSTVL